jgi:hypothetical protein
MPRNNDATDAAEFAELINAGAAKIPTLAACFFCQQPIEAGEPFRLDLVVLERNGRKILANAPHHHWCEIYAIADELDADDDDDDPEDKAREFLADLLDSYIRPPRRDRRRPRR